jgi:hypothetical protein
VRSFSPHAPLLNTLYATAMLQQEVACEQRASHPLCWLVRRSVQNSEGSCDALDLPSSMASAKRGVCPQHGNRAQLYFLKTLGESWASRRKDGVFSWCVSGKKPEEDLPKRAANLTACRTAIKGVALLLET